MNKHLRRAYNELKEITGWQTDVSLNGTMLIGRLPGLRVRIYVNDESAETVIQFADAKTFDRWANSVHFESRRSNEPRLYYPMIYPQYRWARKVIRSGLFDFGSYIGPVNLPWIGKAKRNRG